MLLIVLLQLGSKTLALYLNDAKVSCLYVIEDLASLSKLQIEGNDSTTNNVKLKSYVMRYMQSILACFCNIPQN
jgi:hypothetical protein